MSRFARSGRVFFIEEPIIIEEPDSRLEAYSAQDNITVIVPYLSQELDEAGQIAAQRHLLDCLCRERGIARPLLWYYNPLALTFSAHLPAAAIVYDCMDELTAFHGAPATLPEHEGELLRRADLVFTGGHSLYEAKRQRHPNVHAFPSAVDLTHFRRAREPLPEPEDQAAIPRPRIGHYAVLDERLDTDLLAAVADARPDWQFILIGPVAKIDPAQLPRRPNIHYLGAKDYEALPCYLSGWDAAFMPFALNDATRFISPTKTPEYLAAGRPVVSTPIADVVRHYGDLGLVRIAATPADVVSALERILGDQGDRAAWLAAVDRALEGMSWETTWARMRDLIG